MNQKIATFAGTVIIIIMAITAGMFVWIMQKNNSIETDMQTVIQTKKQVNMPVEESRLVGDGCEEMIGPNPVARGFNMDSANTKIAYVNQVKDISFDVPYNKNWGSQDCKVKPYFENSNLENGDVIVWFGKPNLWEGGDEFSLTFKPQKTADAVVQELKNPNLSPYPNPQKITINNFTIVKSINEGMAVYIDYEIIGKNYNYLFETMEGNTKNLEDIIKTVKLSDINDDTANWKTYRNEKYGFEFKYPAQFTVRDELEDLGQGVFIFGEKDFTGYLRFSLLVNKVGEMTLNDYLVQIIDRLNSDIYEEKSVVSVNDQKNILISGITAVQRIEIHNNTESTEIRTFLKRGDFIFKFVSSIGDLNNISYSKKELYTQILSTFKFIK